ncbi:MAG: alpha/beta fold hydrolase [Cyanobacteria bacterium P01_D01_bin.156]
MNSPLYFSGFTTLSPEIELQLIPDAKPQYLNLGGDAVVICVHGFTGTPYEVAPAARAIANTGLSAVAPLLPGHGYKQRSDQERAFASITKKRMLAAARQEIAQARKQYAHVGMFGFSMGGAISLTMAAEGLLDACAVAAPALRLPLKAERLIPLVGWASFTLEAPHQEPFYVPGYEFQHSWALRALWQVSRHARSQLSKVQCPVLGIHSHNDSTVPPIVLGLMEKHIPQPIETAWFNDSDHLMLLDVSGPDVALTIANFFQRQFLK